MSEIKQILKRAMGRKNIKNAAALSRRSGGRLKEAACRHWLNGARSPSLESATILSQILDVDLASLCSGDRELEKASDGKHESNASQPVQIKANLQRVMIPVFGGSVGGRDGRFALIRHIVDFVPAPSGLESVDGAYAVYVVGDSMSPRYEPGEMVYAHPRKPVKPRDYVVLILRPELAGDPDDGYVKRLVSISDDWVVVEQLSPQKQLKFQAGRVISIHKIVMAGEG